MFKDLELKLKLKKSSIQLMASNSGSIKILFILKASGRP